MNQYLVTGATGQLGNTIVRLLLDNQKQVRVLVHPEEDTTPLAGLPVEVVYGDIMVKDSLKDFFDLPNPREAILVHAQERNVISEKKDLMVRRVNVQGTMNITDTCVKKKIGKLIYIGSAHAIPSSPDGKPVQESNYFDRNKVVGDYAQSKAEATQYILDKVALNGLNAVILLPSAIMGPFEYGESDVVSLIRDYLSGDLKVSVPGGGDFTDVRDVAASVLKASESTDSSKGSCYILSNTYISTQDFLHSLHEITGHEEVTKTVPNWLLGSSGIVKLYYKITRKENPKEKFGLFTSQQQRQYTHERAETELDYNPRDVHQSLEDTVSWVEMQKGE
ncbi:MAG TPA: NAD-dependent epimerase/dehydratase family protein [Bacillota bacterium]|nr:NAD-dependent epimerase/dehydratase family protein [Bacillota bacterium]HPE37961.1 NAD-dependent epimerase/dehydratase family protein [Bacillota bacterium]